MTLGRDKEIKECKVWSTILFNEKGRTGRQTEHLAPTYLLIKRTSKKVTMYVCIIISKDQISSLQFNAIS